MGCCPKCPRRLSLRQECPGRAKSASLAGMSPSAVGRVAQERRAFPGLLYETFPVNLSHPIYWSNACQECSEIEGICVESVCGERRYMRCQARLIITDPGLKIVCFTDFFH